MLLLLVFQALSGIGLVATVLLQMQGGGLSSAFGGTGDVYRSKRSVEKLLVYATIFLSFLFGALSLTLLVIR